MLLKLLLLMSRAVVAVGGGRRTEDSQITVGITNYTIVVTQTGANPL